MKIGAIADTHDNVAAVDSAVEIFDAHDVEVLIHCGDIIAPPVVPRFDGFELHSVLGNNDGEVSGLERFHEDLGKGSQLHGRFAELRIDGTDIAVLHGEDLAEVEAHATEGDYDYVFYGHHHEREDRTVEGTRIVNPGAHFPTVPAEHNTVAIVDLETDTVSFEGV